jgi:predicted MFS family arabinose efflux permease
MLGVYTIVVPAASDGWHATATVTCGVGAVVLLAAFVTREATARNPLMPLRILHSRNVAGANLLQVFGAGGMFGSFFLGALYLQHVLHYSPLEIGLAFLPVSVLMGGLSVRYTEPLVSRFGVRPVMLPGLLLITAGLALFALAPSDGSYLAHVLPVMVLLGVGAGLCFPPTMTLSMSGVAPADAGLASGLINTTGQVGGAIGLALLATVSTGRAAALRADGVTDLAALTGGYHLALWVAALFMLAALVVAVAVVRPPRAEQLTADDAAAPRSLAAEGAR